MDFGTKLTFLRKSRDWSQQHLSDLLNDENDTKVGKGRISQWEHNKNDPAFSTVIQIAQIFGISVDYFMSESNDIDSFKTDSGFSKVKDKYIDLVPRRKEYVNNIIDAQYNEQNNGKIIPLPNAKVVDIVQVHDIQVYDNPVSAGDGEDLFSGHHETVEYRGRLPKDYDVALQISGDSMEPVYHNGQIVFVKCNVEALNGQVVIADLNGKAYIKEIENTSNGIQLISYNEKYEPITIHDYDDFRIMGVVIK